MIRTAVNVTGDAAVSVIVAKSERKLDESLYDDPEAGLLEEEDLEIDETVEHELAEVVEELHEEVLEETRHKKR
jgi:hypothetical protein